MVSGQNALAFCLYGIRQAIFNPGLFTHENMERKIDRPETHPDTATHCVSDFRERNRGRCLTFLSRQGETLGSQRSADRLRPFYVIDRGEAEGHKLKNLSSHLQQIKLFKTAG